MKVYINGAQPGNTFGGSFPPQDAHLDDELVDEFGLREGITRFGTVLAEQIAESRGKRVIGVDLLSISFTIIYGDSSHVQ